MTLLIKISLICLMIYTVMVEGQQNKIKITEENVNIALNDTRYMRRQINCALGTIKCDPIGGRLKSLAPLVIRNNCPQCSPEEMYFIKKVLAHIQNKFPEEWTLLRAKYLKP
ncbi:ejaculatory bulb-specific protein 3-like [Leptopilina boulardi]|uniref:ejaculatory bulb-specific protein 3-like n=1 Tax=Leptopilina boulardi TaxID=63433 RepID=UPI0021F55486|nr:ejaculatory bulb-specific protein 3-like [Leptopilina boulardi]